jgi:hypothetical protein
VECLELVARMHDLRDSKHDPPDSKHDPPDRKHDPSDSKHDPPDRKHDLLDSKHDLLDSKHGPRALVFYLRSNACTFRECNLNFFDFVVSSRILFKIRGVQERVFEIQEAICA